MVTPEHLSAALQPASVGEVLAHAYATADWSGLAALTEQSRNLRGTRLARHLPADLRDAVAQCLTGLAAAYRCEEERFVRQALAVMANVDGEEVFDPHLFRRFYADAHRPAGTTGRRLPALFETVAETGRRLRDLQRLEQALAGTGTSGILCGSTSYGPFYNVRGPRGRAPASDLDVVIVAPDAATLPTVADALRGLAGTDRVSVEQLRERATVFWDRYDNGRTSLSHKLPMWTAEPDPLLAAAGLPGDYHLSLHLLTGQVLGYVLVESSTALNPATAGRQRTVSDYRDTVTRRPDLPRTFACREHRVAPKLEAAQLGWIRSTTACHFDDSDCYCPGFLQMILLPLLDLRWDEAGCRTRLANFERKYFDRYRLEWAAAPHALLRPSFTHVRREDFAPHIVRDFDRER
jgi:hypothetical protein